MRITKYLITLASLALLISSCKQDPNVIAIGGAISQSGDNAMQGTLGMKGMMIAIDEANQAGGVDGKKLSFIPEDTQTKAKFAVNAISKLSRADKVSCIISTGDIEFQAINDIVGKERVVTLATICSGMLEENRSPYLFRYCFNEKIQDAVLMRFVKDSLHVDEVALLYPNNLWGKEIEKYNEEGARAAGIRISAKETYDPSSNDQKGVAVKLLARKPEVICARGFGDGFEALLRYLSELGFQGRIIGDITISLPGTINNTRGIVQGAYYVSVDLKQGGDPVTEHYRQRFRDAYGTEPSVWDALGYDSCKFLIEALRISRAEDIPLREAMFKVRDAGLLLGDNSFSESNDVEFNMSIFQIVDGKQTLVH